MVWRAHLTTNDSSNHLQWSTHQMSHVPPQTSRMRSASVAVQHVCTLLWVHESELVIHLLGELVVWWLSVCGLVLLILSHCKERGSTLQHYHQKVSHNTSHRAIN